MSPQDSLVNRPGQKRAYDIYTVMLFIAFIALLAGCILLYLELRSYGSFPYWKPATSAMLAPLRSWVAGIV